jgi:hypothetical protein
VKSDDDGLAVAEAGAVGPEADGLAVAEVDYLDDIRSRVSDIGTGTRWYDRPYRVIWSLARSRIGKKLPWVVRTRLNRALNYLVVFHQHDRDKAWSREDPLHNVTVPPGDHAHIPGIWVAELFPPSELPKLTASIKRNSWDKQRIWIGTVDVSNEILSRSRAGRGSSWWRLADIASAGAPYKFTNGVRGNLPPEFQAVELVAIQVGDGLTAVIAYFHLSATAIDSVDKVWHSDPEPIVIRGRGRPPIAENRQFTTYRRTQESRRFLHESARGWLARNCPGVFARDNQQQPLIDLILFDQYDPTVMESDRKQDDALRAVGLTGHVVRRCTSPELPGLLLEPPADEVLTPGLRGQPSWALWGREETIKQHLPQEVQSFGGGSRGIANVVHSRARNFLVMIAISELLVITNKKLATLRDDARSRHRQFRVRELNLLRTNLLALSADIASIRRDLDAYYGRAKREAGEASFIDQYSPHIVRWLEREGRPRPDPVNLNDYFEAQQIDGFNLAAAADREYREILFTVASLGASASASRLGRAAIVIAMAALAVAAATLLVTKVDHNAPLAAIGRWVWSLF